MAEMETFGGKTIAVLGLARSGLACAEVLTDLGATVVLYDGKPASELGPAIEAARRLGIEPRVGGSPVDYSELDALITSPGVARRSPILTGAVNAGVPVWSEIEAAYRIARAPIIAITGTNGKTTTTVLVAEMLRAAGKTAYIAGNIAAGDLALPLIKAAHQARSDEVIVAEISSFQLEWVEKFCPRAAAILNITPDHGDRQSWDEYVGAKWCIFSAQTEGDLAVIREDVPADPAGRLLCGNVVKFNASSARQVVETVVPGADILLPGQHNRENFAAAMLLAKELGADDDAVRYVAKNFGGVVHRLEFVAEKNGVAYINNSMCTNVDAFERSLEAIAGPKVVIAGGVFKGDDLAPLRRAVVKNEVRSVVLIGRSAAAIADVLREGGFDSAAIVPDLISAVERATADAQPGDTVMLAPACASFDMFRDFEDRGDRFKAAVRELCDRQK